MNRLIPALFFFFSMYVCSQNNIEKEKYKILALSVLFSEGLNQSGIVINKQQLINFLSNNINVSELEQKSFEGFKFVSIKPLNTDDIEMSSDEIVPIIWDSCKEYIIAISQSNYVFKLKGFKINDFYSFLRQIREKPNMRNKRKFVKNHEVKGLDFECLFNSLKSNSKKNNPCITDTCFKIHTVY